MKRFPNCLILFRPYGGLAEGDDSLPTAYAVGCILPPLRGYTMLGATIACRVPSGNRFAAAVVAGRQLLCGFGKFETRDAWPLTQE